MDTEFACHGEATALDEFVGQIVERGLGRESILGLEGSFSIHKREDWAVLNLKIEFWKLSLLNLENNMPGFTWYLPVASRLRPAKSSLSSLSIDYIRWRFTFPCLQLEIAIVARVKE